MTHSTMMKAIAIALFAALGLVLMPACDKLGLGDGGSGGTDPLGGSPCQNACYSEWDAEMNACASIGSDTDRKACQDSADAALMECLDTCDNPSPSNAKCQEKYENCVNYGPKSCLKVSGGKTQCKRCLERCKVGDSPSSTCKNCLF